MNTKITLTNPTDDELNAAVAEYVAKWKWSRVIDSEFGDKWHLQGKYTESGCLSPGMPWAVHYEVRDRLPDGEEADLRQVPPYATSADAVLPLLYKTYWQVQQTAKAESPLRVRIGAEQDLSFGESDTFPRAACIALLMANGVEVVT